MVVLDDVGDALEQFSMRAHHRLQVDAQTGIVGQWFDNGREGEAVNAFRFVENLIAWGGNAGGFQPVLRAAFVYAGCTDAGTGAGMFKAQRLDQPHHFRGRHVYAVESVAIIKDKSRFRRKRLKCFS